MTTPTMTWCLYRPTSLNFECPVIVCQKLGQYELAISPAEGKLTISGFFKEMMHVPSDGARPVVNPNGIKGYPIALDRHSTIIEDFLYLISFEDPDVALSELDVEQIIKLLDLARSLSCAELVGILKKRLKRHITADNCIDVLQLAAQRDDWELGGRAIPLIRQYLSARRRHRDDWDVSAWIASFPTTGSWHCSEG